MKSHRCCFSGHRPEKLMVTEQEAKILLEKEICQAKSEGFDTFISGAARGVDIWAAEIILSLRAKGMPLHLLYVVPFPGMEQNWDIDWQKRYRLILRQADMVHYLFPEYNRNCFSLRNQWMVDHSSRLIAMFNGAGGGTQQTIAYAQKCEIPCVIVPG